MVTTPSVSQLKGHTRDALLAMMRCIVPAMFKAQEPWAVVGSVASVMQGLPDYEPPDIDIATTMWGAYIMEGCVGNSGATVRPISLSASGPYRSYFGIFEVMNMKVEIMGDLLIRSSDGLIDLRDHWARWSDKVRICEVDGLHIPLVPIEWQLVANLLLGRVERSRGIADFLLDRGYDEPFLETVLEDPWLGERTVLGVRNLLQRER